MHPPDGPVAPLSERRPGSAFYPSQFRKSPPFLDGKYSTSVPEEGRFTETCSAV